MALNYDEFGNVIGEYESEEERRKRLEAAAKAADNTVATEQKVVTYQNGSQTVETKKEIPARAPVIDPNVVANARAMAPPPDAVFQRQLQAESGNRQIDPRTGQIMTSPKGALGIAQVMPATAMQPGFGVPSIFDLAQQQGIQFQNRDEATAKQLLGNQALNQQFGQNYKNAMLQRFGGDQTAATASYNAGPGRVGQNMANNQGNLNVAQLPQETQGYLQKVLGSVGNVVNNMIPSAQAGTLPQGMPSGQNARDDLMMRQQAQPQPMAPTQLPPQPQAQPQAAEPISPYSLATNNTGVGIRAPGIAAGQPMPQPMAQPTINFQNLFQQNQDNINGLTQIIDNPDTPEYLKKRSADRRYELVNNTYMEEKAKAKIPNLTSNEVAKALSTTPRDAEGSWLKFLLMGYISPQLAGAEAIKLGLGPTKWTSTTITDDDGNQTNVEIQSRVDGKILAGNIAGTDQALTPAQLQQAAGLVSLGTSTKPDVGAVYEQKDANGKVTAKGRLVTEFRNNRPQTYIDLGGGKKAKFDSTWTQEAISAAAAKAEATNAIELRYTGPKAYTKAGADFAGKFNAENKTNIGYATETPGAPLVDLNTGKEVIPDRNGNITVTRVGGGTVTQAAPIGTPAAAPAAASNLPLDKLPKAPTMQEGESPAAFAARTKAWSETYGKQYESKEKNVKAAKDLLPFVSQMRDLVNKSTGSGIGSIVDSVGNFVGYSTEGATAIAAITPLASKVLMGVERFEGPQSELDVKTYKEAAGRLSDPTVPAAQKQAAFNTIIDIMKRNAPDLDWNSVSIGQPAVSDNRRRADEIIKKK